MFFAEQYKQLGDDELLRIAGESHQLIPDAALALEHELAKRGLTTDKILERSLEVQGTQGKLLVDTCSCCR